LGAAGYIVSYQVRFTKPVYVPLDAPVVLHSVATLTEVDAASGRATLSLRVTLEGGHTVLGRALIVVASR
jgi:hypothetical protein